MTDTTIIWRYLNLFIDDSHPSIYVYCTSYAARSRETAIIKLMGTTKDIFIPPLTEDLIKDVVKQFLEGKRRAYLKGNIKVTPLYPLI